VKSGLDNLFCVHFFGLARSRHGIPTYLLAPLCVHTAIHSRKKRWRFVRKGIAQKSTRNVERVVVSKRQFPV
jgi:hypothetical protein